MSPKLIGALAAVTLFTTVAAVVVAIEQPDVAPLRSVDEPAFPALRDEPNAVAKAVITTPDGQITLVRETPERWVTPERYGYPVTTDAIRALVIGLADMRLIEAKTSRPERYDRLEVQDVSAEGAKSTLVRLEDADGNVLAEAILGKERQRLTGMQPSGVYLRRPGDEQSWLASGGVEIHKTVQDWLQSTVVDLESESLKRVEIRTADGKAYAVARKDEGAPLRLDDLGEDEQPREGADLGQLARAFSGLELADVKPADQLAWPDKVSRVELATFDGLQLEAKLAMVEGEPWLAIERVEGPAPATAAEQPVATATGGAGQAQAAEASDAGSKAKAPADAAQPEKAQETPADPRAIAERTRGWAYQISKPIYENLTTPRPEWLEEGDGTS